MGHDHKDARAVMSRALFAGLLASLVILLGFVLLPYVLPLGGPDTVPPLELADPDGAFVAIAGEHLYYTHVPGEAPPVILLHGFGGSTVSWRDSVPVLVQAGYAVYAVDLLGFGLSEKGWEHDYSHPAQAARVIGFMDALGIDRAVIVGHSMGGSVAAHLALRHPQRVDRLVLVSAPIVSDGETSSMLPVPAALLDLPLVRQWGRLLIRGLVVPEFDSLLFDAAYRDGMIDASLVEGYRRVLQTPEWDLGLLGIMRDARTSALGDAVRALEMPVLLLWGTEDTWVPPEAGARLEALLPHAERVEFAGVGHLPMHEVPDQFNLALLEFLAR